MATLPEYDIFGEVGACMVASENDNTARNIEFGHIHIPQWDFSSYVPFLEIEKSIKAAGGNHHDTVIHIGSELERDHGATAIFRIRTWQEFTRIVHNNRDIDPGTQAFGPQPLAWTRHQILPRQAVLVISIEPQMPADCAMALIVAIHWAFSISKEQDSRVRIITFSPERLSPTLASLVKLYSSDMELKTFGLPPTVSCDFSRYTEGCHIIQHAGVFRDKISATVMSKRIDASHAVVCFPPRHRVLNFDCNMSWSRSGREDVLYHELEESLTLADISHACVRRTSKIHALLAPHGFRSPFGIKPVSYLHVVPSSTGQRRVYDLETNQIIQMDVSVSRDEFMEQLSWTRRATCHPARVYIYVNNMDLLSPTAGKFDEERSVDVANHQMGGFIAAVCGLVDWGIDPRGVLPCFISDSRALEKMSRVLCAQNILSITPFGLGMSETQSRTFLAILSMVKYEHRIAYFLTLPAADGMVVRAKAQLAALLTQGLDTISASRSVHEIETAPLGNGGTLAGQGTMWTKLVLWKRAVRIFAPAWESFTGKYPQTGDMTIDRTKAISVQKLAFRLLVTLGDLGISTAPGEIDTDLNDLDEDQCLLLQRHLFLAYYDQLTTLEIISHHKQVRFDPEFEFRHVGSQTRLHRVPLWDFDLDRIVENENGSRRLFGVFHGLKFRSETGKFDVEDWTWIPSWVVREVDDSFFEEQE